MFTGIGHLTHQRDEFQAQVPEWFPIDADIVVVVPGVIEVVLGLALILVSGRRRSLIGWIIAAFFVVVFPVNIAQWLEGTDAFGLDTDTKRFVRLFFQPALISWALWSTGAWRAWRTRRLRSALLRLLARATRGPSPSPLVRGAERPDDVRRLDGMTKE